jgi:hypothetical protein
VTTAVRQQDAWRTSRHPGPGALSAQIVGAEIERIESVAGVCSPRALVNESRPEDAPLHEVFEWDNEVAGEQFRVIQARAVIRNVVIVDGESALPAFVHVTVTDAESDEDREGYMNSAAAMAEARTRTQVLREAVGQLNGLRRRYADLQELAVVWTAVDQVVEQVMPAETDED